MLTLRLEIRAPPNETSNSALKISALARTTALLAGTYVQDSPGSPAWRLIAQTKAKLESSCPGLCREQRAAPYVGFIMALVEAAAW